MRSADSVQHLLLTGGYGSWFKGLQNDVLVTNARWLTGDAIYPDEADVWWNSKWNSWFSS